MRRLVPLLAGVALLSAVGEARAIEPYVEAGRLYGAGFYFVPGTDIAIGVGGGAQLFDLPGTDFTFYANSEGEAVRRQRNNDLDEYGGVGTLTVVAPFVQWQGAPVSVAVSSFFSEVSHSNRTRCASNDRLDCAFSDIVDEGHLFTAEKFTTKTDREANFWGVDAELRFGSPLRPAASPQLFRFSYVGIGADLRGLDQDNFLRIRSDLGGVDTDYREKLDTTYAGAFVSIGGEYDVLGYLGGIGSGWGLRSAATLRFGVYNADTDYRGSFTPLEGDTTTRLNLSEDEVAFIGAANFETTKRLGRRTSLSLVTNYEFYSYIPQVRYADGTNPTRLDDDDGWQIRTTLRLNVLLGGDCPECDCPECY